MNTVNSKLVEQLILNHTHLQPLDIVFRFLLDEAHALQHVGDVIQAPLLDVERVGGLVQIQHAIGRLSQQLAELLGQEAKRRVIARLLGWGFRS